MHDGQPLLQETRALRTGMRNTCMQMYRDRMHDGPRACHGQKDTVWHELSGRILR